MTNHASIDGNDARTLIKFLEDNQNGVWETNFWRYPPSGGETDPPDVPAPLEVHDLLSWRYWVVVGDADAARAALRAMPQQEREAGAFTFVHARYDNSYRQIEPPEVFLRRLGV